jgi:hypothetical protein
VESVAGFLMKLVALAKISFTSIEPWLPMWMSVFL